MFLYTTSSSLLSLCITQLDVLTVVDLFVYVFIDNLGTILDIKTLLSLGYCVAWGDIILYIMIRPRDHLSQKPVSLYLCNTFLCVYNDNIDHARLFV